MEHIKNDAQTLVVAEEERVVKEEESGCGEDLPYQRQPQSEEGK